VSGVGVHDDGPDGDQRLAGMLFAAEARADPYPLYRQVAVPGCRHAAAAAMLRDPRLGPPALEEPATGELLWTTFARWLLNLDGERHQRMRQRFSRIFTPRRVEQYRPMIQARADELLDAVIDARAMDVVGEFALPLNTAMSPGPSRRRCAWSRRSPWSSANRASTSRSPATG
jgi:cytochrome P450